MGAGRTEEVEGEVIVAVRITPKTETVLRCVPRQDGGYMIITKKGSGSSPVALHLGAAVILRDGQAVRP